MIYRYDQPVDMPIPELYDTGLMQAYTQAIREQFEKGEKRLDEFASKYGNFTSPFAKDIQEWDSLTMGRINNIYNDLVSKGIDPLRSREGQAIMAQAIRQTPVGKLNMLKQSAETGSAYQRAIQDAMRRGEYNPEFEKWALGNLGISSFNDYDTLKSGQWQRTAPDVWKTLGDATNTWFDEIKPTDKGRKNGFLWRGIDMNDLLNAARPRAQAFGDTQLGKYNKYLIKNQLKQRNPFLSDAELDDLTNKQFVKDIAATHSEKMQMLPETDPYAMLAEKDKYDARNMARQFDYNKKLAKLKNGDSNAGYPASFSTERDASTTAQQNQNIKDFATGLIKSKKNYYQTIINNIKDKNSKKYKDAITYLNYWKTVEKHPFNPGGNLQPLYVVGEHGEVLPSKFLRGKYAEQIGKEVRKGGSDATARYINAYTREMAGENATVMKNAISSRYEKIPGSNLTGRVVNYGTGRFTYSAVKIKGMYGGKGSKVQRLFNTWLKSKNVKAYMTGGTIRHDRQPGRNTSGVNTYYFDTYITDNEMNDFVKYCKDKGVSLSDAAIYKHLGITEERTNLLTKDEKSSYGSNANYHHLYKFSTAHTSTDNYEDSNADIEWDKKLYGSSNAYALSQERQMLKAAQTLNLQ